MRGQERDEAIVRVLASVGGSEDDGAIVVDAVRVRQQRPKRDRIGVERRLEASRGQVPAERSVEIETALLIEQHGGEAGERLRRRRNVEDRLRRHRPPRFDIRPSESLRVDDLRVTHDRDRHAWGEVEREKLREGGVETRGGRGGRGARCAGWVLRACAADDCCSHDKATHGYERVETEIRESLPDSRPLGSGGS